MITTCNFKRKIFIKIKILLINIVLFPMKIFISGEFVSNKMVVFIVKLEERIYANGIMVPIDAIEDLLKDVKST